MPPPPSFPGTHSPGSLNTAGNGPGIQRLDYLIYSGGNPSVTWDLFDNTVSGPGTSFDSIYIEGDLTFNSATTLELDFSQGAVDWNDSFWSGHVIREWQIWGLTGGGNINYGPGLGLSDISLAFADSGNDGQDQAFAPGSNVPSSANFYLFQNSTGIYLRYEALPEPGTLGFLGLTLTCLAFFTRRRRQRNQ